MEYTDQVRGKELRTEELFTEIANEHMTAIYNFVRYMVFDHEEANDIVQKTFISLYENFEKVDRSRPIKPWLYKVARNHCLDHFRKKKAYSFSETENEVENIPESDIGIEQQLDSSMYLDKVKEKIKELPPDYKEVLLLKYFEDFTFEQIAESLDMPVNTAKSNFYRGKAKIFKSLQDDHGYNR
jgi:RNA polymerase sigma-70 factor, ECF subfamily